MVPRRSANEYHLFRDEDWVNKMGTLIRHWDPYDHLASVHGHGKFPFRTSAWADFAMHQQWDEGGGYAFIRACRDQQAKTGRIMPQVNEEYGYEDHYPQWGGNRKWPARTADNRRRLAWSMVMAGGYRKFTPDRSRSLFSSPGPGRNFSEIDTVHSFLIKCATRPADEDEGTEFNARSTCRGDVSPSRSILFQIFPSLNAHQRSGI